MTLEEVIEAVKNDTDRSRREPARVVE